MGLPKKIDGGADKRKNKTAKKATAIETVESALCATLVSYWTTDAEGVEDEGLGFDPELDPGVAPLEEGEGVLEFELTWGLSAVAHVDMY